MQVSQGALLTRRDCIRPAYRLTCFLLTDHYLLKWEQEHRVQSERWRTAARSGERFSVVSSFSWFSPPPPRGEREKEASPDIPSLPPI